VAKYVLPLASLVAGGFIGGLFTSGAWSGLGASLGLSLGMAFFGPQPNGPQPQQIEGLRVAGVDYGGYVGDFYGVVRTAGTWIDASPGGGVVSVQGTEKVKTGTGGKKKKVKTFNYFLTAGYALGEGLLQVDKVWADEKLIFDRNAATADERGYEMVAESSGGQVVAELSDGLRFYRGSRKQLPDTILAALHDDGVPAYRGTAYIVFNNFDLAPYSNRIPTFTALVRRVDAAGNTIDDVAEIITLHAKKSGFPEEFINLTHLVGLTVPGCFQTQRGAARPLIEQLARWHKCGVAVVGQELIDYSRANPTIHELTWSELGPVDLTGGQRQNSQNEKNLNAPFPRERASARELPTHIILRRPDPGLNYDFGTVEDIWQTAPVLGEAPDAIYKPETIEVQIVAEDSEAAPRVGLWKDEMLAAREHGSVTLDSARLNVAPGDVLKIPTSESETDFVYLMVDEQTFFVSGLLECKGSGWNADLYTRNRTLPNNPRPTPGVEYYAAPTIALIDTASVDDATIDTPVLIVAASAPSETTWRGAGVELAFGGRLAFRAPSYTLIADRAVMGELVGSFPLGSTTTFDWVRTLTVRLIHGHLNSVSEDEAGNGANLLAVGNRLIRFCEAVEDPGDPGLYTLTGIMDAENGTDWTGTIADGSKVVLLQDETGALGPGLDVFTLSRTHLGLSATATASAAYDTNKTSTLSQTFAGNSIKPLSPVHITADRTVASQVSLGFDARTRYVDLEWSYWEDGIEPPFSDLHNAGTLSGKLQFEIVLRDGSNVIQLTRTISGAPPDFSEIFTNAALTAADLNPASLRGEITCIAPNGRGFSRSFTNL
jgi:hypothetical protein